MSDDLTVTHRRDGKTAWVEAEGIIDMQSMRPFRETVRDLIAGDIGRMVIDLQGVIFMDSAGISVLIMAEQNLRDRDGEVCVIAGEGPVRRMFQAIQLDRLVRLVSSPEELPALD